MFRLPRLLDPQVAPTAEMFHPQGGQALYPTHRSVGYLPRDVVSLRVRHEQLTRLDFHQLDCSLVGRSALFVPRLAAERPRDERHPDLGGRTRSVRPPNQGAERSGVLPAGQDVRSIELFCGA